MAVKLKAASFAFDPLCDRRERGRGDHMDPKQRTAAGLERERRRGGGSDTE